MRVATEMDFEVYPTDGLDFVTDQVKDALEKIRTIDDEKKLTIKVFVDVEIE